MKSSISRARAAVATAVTTGLCLAGTTVLATPSQAATGTCDTAYPVANITKGQSVTGLTVDSGVTPSPFTGTVLGVITDGVEPGVDLVMAQLSSPAIDDAGIWAGMSGSPVYAEDGSLIGAVSYTLAWGQTPIAGITPWEDMDKYAGQLPQTVRVPTESAHLIARSSSLTSTQAEEGFRELAAPVVAAGVSQRTVDGARTRPYLSKSVSAAGHTATESSPLDMIAGGNMVATMSTGDITIGGLGTITSVCNDRLVGFGHPMNFLGQTTYGLAGADTLYVQKDPLGSSFKVANVGTLLGTIDQDRMTGVSGPLGTVPASMPITSTVAYQGDSRTGETDVQFRDAAAEAAYYELATNHQALLDSYGPGGEQQTWTITGDVAGEPFTLTGGNVYADKYSIADGASYDVPDLLYLLTRLKSVTVDSVDVHSDVNDNTSRLKIDGVQQRRAGSWVNVTRRHPALVRAGRTAKLRLVFTNGKTRRFQIAVPAKARGLDGEIDVSGGYPYPFERGGLGSFAKIENAVHNLVRNDQAQIQFLAFGKRHVVRVRTTTAPAGKVLTGSRYLPVVVR
ncbi:MAG TPA: hypothetical protein VGK78_18790 [Nocardioides sp.]|uniref:hypothetical protein n=1 Tax=Nocardioides sp. TaxID=35761 RepID=UPI002F407693